MVELIISISIMVILVALIAPSLVKYVQKARDTSLLHAAEDVFSFARTEYSSGNLMGKGKIQVEADEKGIVHITFLSNGSTKLKYFREDYGNKEEDGEALFADLCGANSAKRAISKLVYTIEIVSVDVYDTKITYKETF